MLAALNSLHIIHKREEVLRVAVVILQPNRHFNIILLAFKGYGTVQHFLIPVYIF